MEQNTVTFVTTFASREARASAEALLRAEQVGIEAGAVAAWRALGGLHFLSLVIIPGGERGRGQLVLEANFDGSKAEFRTALVAARRNFLDELYANCEGYPGAQATDAQVCKYLRGADLGYDLFYVASPGRNIGRIEFEQATFDRLQRLAATVPPLYGTRADYVRSLWDGLPAQDRERIQNPPSLPWWTGDFLSRNHVLASVQLLAIAAIAVSLAAIAWGCVAGPDNLSAACLVPPHRVQVLLCALAWFIAVLSGLGLLGSLALLAHEFPRATRWWPFWRILGYKLLSLFKPLPFAILWCIGALAVVGMLAWKIKLLFWLGIVIAVYYVVWIALRLARIASLELDDRVDGMSWDAARLARLREREERSAQNHFVSVTRIKPGALRVATLRFTLRAINVLWRLYFNPRGLSGIPSIHFARWLVMPGGRRLVFITNYDGAWGGYLTDFVSMAGGWMNAIWGHCRGFPRTYFLVGGGTRDEQRFKCFARNSQAETLLWYQRYPALTVSAIGRNAQVCADLKCWAEKEFGARRGDYDGNGKAIDEARLDAWLRRF